MLRILRARLILIVVILFSGLVRADQPVECQAELTVADAPAAAAAAELAAAKRFQSFFKSIEAQLFERGFFLEVSKLALLAKEHVLMFGPPGNAKSMGVDLIIDNIVDDKTGQKSVFKIQMTPETSLSETHGVIDYKKITEENIQTRKWEQSLLFAKNVFIDEFFDARANAIRNNLMALNEREHAQGHERITGVTETGFAATNKYINEIYEKAGDDGPKAIIDRFAFVAFVPGELAEVRSALSLIMGMAPLKPEKMTFQDLDLLRAKINEVKIPEYVGRMLTLVFTRMKAQTEALEESEKKRFLDQKKSGLTPLPPYRATKYYSPRTLRKAGKILRAIVVNDWINSGGTRALSANSQDLEKLVDFFTLNSMDDEFLGRLEETTVNPYEKIQIMTVTKERALFRDIYSEMMSEVNGQTSLLTDFEIERESAVTPELKKALIEKMIVAMLDTVVSGDHINGIHELNETSLANDYLKISLETSLRELLGDDFDKTVAKKIKKIENERKARIAEEQRKERERIAHEREEQRKAELAERRRQERREANIQRMQNLRQTLQSPGLGHALIQTNYPSGFGQSLFTLTQIGEQRWEILAVDNNQIIIKTLDFKSGKESEAISWALPARDNEDGPIKMTRLENGNYLIWYGNFGRLLDTKTGLVNRKIIYETNDGQMISNNSAHGEVWVHDGAAANLGVVSVDKINEIAWFPLTDLKFEEEYGTEVQQRNFFDDFASDQSSLYLSQDKKGIAYLVARESTANYLVNYEIDLNKKRVKMLNHDSVSQPFPYVGVAARLSRQANSAFPSHDVYGMNGGLPSGHYKYRFYKRDPRVAKPPAPLEFDLQRTVYDRLNQSAWALSPEETYIVYGLNNRLMGYDLINDEEFEITRALGNESMEQLYFLDEKHLVVVLSDGLRIYAIPDAQK